jgi:hypothetical protein
VRVKISMVKYTRWGNVYGSPFGPCWKDLLDIPSLIYRRRKVENWANIRGEGSDIAAASQERQRQKRQVADTEEKGQKADETDLRDRAYRLHRHNRRQAIMTDQTSCLQGRAVCRVRGDRLQIQRRQASGAEEIGFKDRRDRLGGQRRGATGTKETGYRDTGDQHQGHST